MLYLEVFSILNIQIPIMISIVHLIYIFKVVNIKVKGVLACLNWNHNQQSSATHTNIYRLHYINIYTKRAKPCDTKWPTIYCGIVASWAHTN